MTLLYCFEMQILNDSLSYIKLIFSIRKSSTGDLLPKDITKCGW